MKNKSSQFNRLIQGSNTYQIDNADIEIMSSVEEARAIADKVADDIVKKLQLQFNFPSHKNK